jgi:hypothetical protein
VTENKTLKRRVRERMSKTGERYTAARRQVLGKAKSDAATSETPAAAAAVEQHPPGQPEEALHGPTNRTWSEWVRVLDDWGARDRPHTEIARWLADEMGVPPWWTQDITVRYEKHIGRRVLGQRGSTFSATATKTIAVHPDAARAAWVDEPARHAWLPDVRLSQRPNRVKVAARFDVNDADGRLIVSFEPKAGGAKTLVAVEHEKLPDAAAAKRWTTFWRQRLIALKEVLEA